MLHASTVSNYQPGRSDFDGDVDRPCATVNDISDQDIELCAGHLYSIGLELHDVKYQTMFGYCSQVRGVDCCVGEPE